MDTVNNNQDEFYGYYLNGDLDIGFEHGNAFNLVEDPTKVVVQWLDYNDVVHEEICDTYNDAMELIDNINKEYLEQQILETKSQLSNLTAQYKELSK